MEQHNKTSINQNTDNPHVFSEKRRLISHGTETIKNVFIEFKFTLIES